MTKRNVLLYTSYRVIVPPSPHRKEMEEYAWDNCRGDFATDVWINLADRSRTDVFEFADETDAMLFKMRWVG